ncbi:MAG TPA: hypothetical protein VIE89_14915 [Candidatus Binatia bacterium]
MTRPVKASNRNCILDLSDLSRLSSFAFCILSQIEFTEWTPDRHLRHSRFVGLREDKDPKAVLREAP